MSERRQIILYIDPEQYESEAGEPLSDERLDQIGSDVNDDAAGIYGYEGWEVK